MPQALCSRQFVDIVCRTATLSLVLACSYFFAKIKGALSGLRQFWAALFVLKIFKFFVLTFWSCSKTA